MIQHWVFKNYDASFPFKSANYQCLVAWTLAASHFTKAAISFFVIAELDRVGSDHIEREGHQLRKKCLGELLRRMFSDLVKKVVRSMFHPSLLHPISRYRGSIRFASCSQETLGIYDCNTSQQLCRFNSSRQDWWWQLACRTIWDSSQQSAGWFVRFRTDRTNIWDEIGDKEHEVDNAIHVLISAGTSSPSLRHAAQRGVDIEEAGHAETAIAVVFLGPLLVLCTLTAKHGRKCKVYFIKSGGLGILASFWKRQKVS